MTTQFLDAQKRVHDVAYLDGHDVAGASLEGVLIGVARDVNGRTLVSFPNVAHARHAKTVQRYVKEQLDELDEGSPTDLKARDGTPIVGVQAVSDAPVLKDRPIHPVAHAVPLVGPARPRR